MRTATATLSVSRAEDLTRFATYEISLVCGILEDLTEEKKGGSCNDLVA